MKKKWYQITNKSEDETEILIYEQIGESFWDEGVSAKTFVIDLQAVKTKTINLHINSPGGNVFDGLAIYNSLKAHKAEINVYIDGMAASIASVIAMSGDTVSMPENAMMMIHDPAGVVMGTAEEMTEMADTLRKVKSGLVSVYVDNTGQNKEEIEKLMAEETWLTAHEALNLGFASEVTGTVSIQNNFSGNNIFNSFKNFPTKNAGIKPAERIIMEKSNVTPDITADLLRKDYPEITNDFLAEGRAAERERIKSVYKQSIPGHETLIETLAMDGKTTGPEAAVRILAEEKQIREKLIKDNIDDAPDPVVIPKPKIKVKTDIKNMTNAERLKHVWDNDTELREEFAFTADGDMEQAFKDYMKFEEMNNSGQVRILAGKDGK